MDGTAVSPQRLHIAREIPGQEQVTGAHQTMGPQAGRHQIQETQALVQFFKWATDACVGCSHHKNSSDSANVASRNPWMITVFELEAGPQCGTGGVHNLQDTYPDLKLNHRVSNIN